MGDKSKIELAHALSRELLDQGKIIAAGWLAFRLYVMPKDAPKIQIQEMEKAFFAGAQHLWASIMSGLDEDAEPTAQDERRMELIEVELDAFAQHMQAEIECQGRA